MLLKTWTQAVLLSTCVLLIACAKPSKISAPSEAALVAFPPEFGEPLYKGGDMPLSSASIALGRKLFYDPILSRDSSISCGSCHSQVHAFADHGVALSYGVEGRKGTRNAPALSNLAWHSSFMNDGGINHLEVLPLAPINADFEMDEEIGNVLEKLKGQPAYMNLFSEAFNQQEINSKSLFVALAHFQMSLVSNHSKYDKVIRGETQFTDIESQGNKVFMQQCSSCHTPPLFSDFSFANNGLKLQYSDAGRALITGLAEDSALFKVPSLRNVALSYPYMHNGSISSLSEVIDHYTSGVTAHRNLDDRMQGVSVKPEDKEALLAFLKTLSDYEFVSNPKHSEP